MSTPTAFTPPLKPKTRATPPPAPRALIVGDGPRKLGNSTANEYVLAMIARELKHHQYQVVSHSNNPNSLLMTQWLSDKVYLEPVNRSWGGQLSWSAPRRRWW
ncbi:carbamoyl phosphate synthase preATP-grasp domain-containing protein [Lactobacillus helveticus]|uniref:carbamoyl phosphate synthase preATP-grasp domain-containing protein n=1 Tax=Lactobacillus helveticus TaxID=1587 RepID=UPI004032EE1D